MAAGPQGSTRTHSVTLIAGDGIGPEVTEAVVRILEAAVEGTGAKFAWEPFLVGANAFEKHGEYIPQAVYDSIERNRVALKGPVTTPVAGGFSSINVHLRKKFELFANFRPIKNLPGMDMRYPGVDLIIVRENTEGEYAQVGGFVYMAQPEEVAIQTSVFTRRGVERVVRYAFELAVKRGKKMRVTSITKSNAQGYGMGLWDRTFRDVAIEFPGIQTESLLVDAAAMNFIRRPDTFDVVVASNLFGDILSDISAIVVGSMGLAASANLDPSRRFPSMFEPVHGSAPDIAGKGVVNPLAAILSAAMMLEHLEQPAAARDVEQAVAAVLAEGKVRTPDLGGANSTQETTDAVLEKMA